MRAFQNGQEIRFCGSGVLAAAHYLESNNFSYKALQLKDRIVQLRSMQLNGHRLLGFEVARAQFHPVEKIGLWQQLVRSPVNAVHFVGLHAGYAIVEVGNERAIAKLRPNLTRLAQLSQRALIVTAAAEKNGDYVCRYFAPQFGNPEDAATGSANALLIQYWGRRLDKRQLLGRQLSQVGGLFYGRINARHVTLYGQTELMAAPPT